MAGVLLSFLVLLHTHTYTHSIRVPFFIAIKFVVTQIVVDVNYTNDCGKIAMNGRRAQWWRREKRKCDKDGREEWESNEKRVLYYYSVGLWQYLYITNIITMVVIILGHFHGKWGKSIHGLWDWWDNQIDVALLLKLLCVCVCVCLSSAAVVVCRSSFRGRTVRDDYFLWQVHISEKVKKKRKITEQKKCGKRHFNLRV